MHRQHAVLLVAHLAGMRERRALHRLVIGAELFEHAQAVLVDVDAGAGRPKFGRAFVQPHAPALPGERYGGGETRKSATDDFGMSFGLHVSCWSFGRPKGPDPKSIATTGNMDSGFAPCRRVPE